MAWGLSVHPGGKTSHHWLRSSTRTLGSSACVPLTPSIHPCAQFVLLRWSSAPLPARSIRPALGLTASARSILRLRWGHHRSIRLSPHLLHQPGRQGHPASERAVVLLHW
ncbi:hypothetical protein BS78_07G092000 [Paspalum vaginatum]|nr:hypothetical protein BS78_07G092000 [Paspalum vaginatum]